MTLAHSYPFDPTYGYSPEELLRVKAPSPPADFASFWMERHRSVRDISPEPRITPAGWQHDRYRVFDLQYRSSGGFTLGGWALLPARGEVRRGFVVGHGYAGREGPDLDLPFDDAALLFPCFRGVSRSRCARIPAMPHDHVVTGIEDRHRYVMGGCVDDLWLGISALLEWFPAVQGHIGYLGISFGGGIGALALPWDERIRRAHLNVPTFGHQPLRLTLPTVGSGEALRRRQAAQGGVMDTLAYYDAASAALHVRVPVHVAAALFDPAVAPPGQFAIHNALPGPKELFVLDAGHVDYPRKREQERELSAALARFFEPL